MSFVNILPAYWAMKPEALRKAVNDAASHRADLAPREAGALPGERKLYRLENGLAIIPVQGNLLKEFHYPPFWTSYVVVRAQLEAALSDPDVRAVLLDIDSPGGTVAGFQDLADAVFAARSRKPVYAWTDGTACSAAYGVGAGAKLFAASPMAEVGSVGVVWVHTEWTKYDERVGLTVTVLRAGEFKALGNEFEALDTKAREVHQATLEGMYSLFRASVAKARGLSEKNFEDWAEGRVFLAGDAVKVGLLDHACPKDEYLSIIMKEVNMNPTELRAQFPDAVAAIEADAAKTATAAAEDRVAQAKESVVALAGTLFGQEAVDKLSAAVEAGLTAEQAAKLGLSAQPPAQAGSGDGQMKNMLDALQQTDPSGVKPGASKPAGENLLLAAVTKYTKE
ncbi:protein C Serine peptidase. MEROPS family S49 [Humidesulfovibrio mexicanus]|uniref:Protein C Serine peptidase. MEROPS family S49 n=1 Tax=Humidesulfovibrio mexicanus TaxID=147047 RepID=A0A239C8T3_9BACT|nr:S49 family peptidase [Humidesulfovibrio mexicanus]SNS16656.1 protein C Serine peptidase. MEROPS family S49 [Humidesulfovibrio mexicanus]